MRHSLWADGLGRHSWRGQVGGTAQGPLPGRGGRSVKSIFHHRLPTPGAPAPIAFPVRISKAALGLFRSGNLILRWVYFSTLENSQCRTRSEPSRTQPAHRPPSFPGGRCTRGGRGARARAGGTATDRVLRAACTRNRPHGAGLGAARRAASLRCTFQLLLPDLGAQLGLRSSSGLSSGGSDGVPRPEEPSPEDAEEGFR